jgi:sterol desaturase/sphingolipid hydroxylase (fatty acid hydroxylase superfamily)
MLAETSLGYLGWTWGIGLLQLAAWINPGAADGWQWDYTCPNILLMGYYALAVLMAYDAYSYPVHKWMHENKTAFNWMHRKHHDQKAALDATSSGYMELTEGVVSANIPNAVLYVLGMATGNWWMTLAGDCVVSKLRTLRCLAEQPTSPGEA